MEDWEHWFERVWRYRDETLFPRIFGTRSEGGIFVLTFDLFKDRFGEASVDPRWLNHGVLIFPPRALARSWRFVTSGLSNAWEAERPEPKNWSGLGVEFILETTKNAEWALSVVAKILAYQLLLGTGRFGTPRVIEPYARIPLNGAIDGSESILTHLIVCPSSAAAEELELESGKFTLLQLVGATDAEIQFARAHGGEELLALFKANGVYPTIDPGRASIV
jgi:hypothetical protein